jgi:PucR C-terminal helix-turn-helix domain/GAF domain/GGDEF-like domain
MNPRVMVLDCPRGDRSSRELTAPLSTRGKEPTMPSSAAESANSTVDPDARARRANDGEPSAGFHSDQTIGAVDGLLGAEELADAFDANLDDANFYAEYRRLAAEQAALRRLAMLVARGAEPSEVFDAVVNEMRRCLSAHTVGLWRYETSGEITLLAVDYGSPAAVNWPASTRVARDGNTLAAMVQHNGGPARMDSYENVAGSLAARVREVGVRAAVGVPVVVDGRVWGLAAVGWAEPEPMPADTEGRISGFAELIGIAVVAGYRDEQRRQMLDDSSRHSLLIDALLEGRVRDDFSLGEVAGNLRLPKNGPFVVIAAEVRPDGVEPLPTIESKLRSLDVYSAWQLQPDWQVGIVHVKSEQQLDKIVALVSRTTVDRVGISARFDDLRETAQALHFAKMTRQGRPTSASRVAVFDGTIVATAALAAPEVMVKSASTILARFCDLPDEEREILFETFWVWQETDASLIAAAERLSCHPNTVRYRLRRIERRTGLSLSRPRDAAELCLAFEVYHRLI